MSNMTSGRLAEEAGVKIDTIRYYERNGLLPYARQGRPIAAGLLYPVLGVLLSPVIASSAMSL